MERESNKRRKQSEEILKIGGVLHENERKRVNLISNIQQEKAIKGGKVIKKSNYITKNYG